MNFFQTSFYLFSQDKEKKILRFCLKKPFFSIAGLFRSFFFHKKSLEKGTYLYGLPSLSSFFSMLEKKEITLVLALSYCQKNSSYKDALFAEIQSLISPNDHFLILTTAREMAYFWIDKIQKNDKKKYLFLIAACPFSQKIFERFASFLKIFGVGLPLKGAICSNFFSFSFAEKGKKRGKTDLLNAHKDLIIKALRKRRSFLEGQA